VHKTRILVTGATGFIGSHVARLLAQTGRMPRLMFRRPHRAALIAPLDAELVCADIDSRQSLRRAVAGVDAVIHLAARATFERYAALKPTVVDGTRALAEAAAEAGVRTFVFGSSTFVHGNHAEPITSDTPTDPAIDYGVAKCEAERALQEVAEKTAMQLGVLRLPHVYGPESLLFTYAREGRVLFAGAFDQVFSHLHVADAARALVGAAEGAWTGVAPIADRQPVAWRTFFSVLATYQPKLRILRIPAPLSLTALRLVEPLAHLRKRPSMLAPDTIVGWSLRQAVDNEDIWRGLGIERLYPSVYLGIPATLDSAIPYRWLHPLADHG
jgi:nucleoside-diphosphate-sugar epimerase